MLQEIMQIDEAAELSFIESVLVAENIDYVIAGNDVEGGLALGAPVRLLVTQSAFNRAVELLANTGFKQEICAQKDTR